MAKSKKPVSLLKRPHAKNLQIKEHNRKQQATKRKSEPDTQTPRPEQATKKAKTSNAGTSIKHDRGIQPVNPIHRHAAHAVDRLLQADATGRHGASLKSLTLAPHIEAKKAVYAITIETLKHILILRCLLDDVPALSRPTSDLSEGVACVLIRDVLWGQGIKPLGPAENAVLAQTSALKNALSDLMKRHTVSSVPDLLIALSSSSTTSGAAAPHPRWARVNTLKLSVEQALEQLNASPNGNNKNENNNSTGGSMPRVKVDQLIPELLCFPAGTDLHDHPLVLNGSLIQQSKASCITARALDPKSVIERVMASSSSSLSSSLTSGNAIKKWRMIDACAAPGNKTTHLAALVHSALQGAKHLPPSISSDNRVVAFDKDPKRLQRLITNCSTAGAAGIVSAHCTDFLSIDPTSHEYSDIVAVLLDPSCSGSGTVQSRMDFLLPSAVDKPKGEAALQFVDERVEKLANFQEGALKHALKFPRVVRIAYSTCSVHIRENEGVVAAVLEEARAVGFDLVKALPTWHRRGIAGAAGLSKEEAEMLIRTDSDEDGTDGFFVAVFERRRNQEQPQTRSSGQATALPSSSKTKTKKKNQKKKETQRNLK